MALLMKTPKQLKKPLPQNSKDLKQPNKRADQLKEVRADLNKIKIDLKLLEEEEVLTEVAEEAIEVKEVWIEEAEVAEEVKAEEDVVEKEVLEVEEDLTEEAEAITEAEEEVIEVTEVDVDQEEIEVEEVADTLMNPKMNKYMFPLPLKKNLPQQLLMKDLLNLIKKNQLDKISKIKDITETEILITLMIENQALVEIEISEKEVLEEVDGKIRRIEMKKLLVKKVKENLSLGRKKRRNINKS